MADGAAPGAGDPIGNVIGQITSEPRRLLDLLEYCQRVFGINELLEGIVDTRQNPRVPMLRVVRTILLMAILRIRSFNALDARLADATLQRALGGVPSTKKPVSVDTLAYALARTKLDSVRAMLVQIVSKAERNKVFREGSYQSMRFVAIDGCELVSSYERHCDACLTREVKDGKKTRTQYYHAYVVAFVIDERCEVVLDMEPIRSADVRIEAGETGVQGHEGELTAAKRLVPRLRATYGGWLDVLVVDALYGNGPFLSIARDNEFGVIAVLKKETDEPLREALHLWRGQPPSTTFRDQKREEDVEIWDCPDLETLQSYDGHIRVVRGVVRRKDQEPHTWCFAVTGKAAKLAGRYVLAAGRSRWHIENTGFYQWVYYWRFGHVFTHQPTAMQAILWICFAAFNLLQVYMYRQLRSYGREQGKDVTRTILRLVDEMIDDLARLMHVFDWASGMIRPRAPATRTAGPPWADTS